MIKIITIIGARPQIIKAAALNPTIRQVNSVIPWHFENLLSLILNLSPLREK